MFKSMASLLAPAMVSYKGRSFIGPDDPKGSNPEVNSDALPDDDPIQSLPDARATRR